MNTQELEAILEGGSETQRIEFKGPCQWNCQTFIKDILAMANLIDGGLIIVGVEENKEFNSSENKRFQRKGLTPKQINTLNEDIMRDQVSNYTDPFVDFKVFRIKDTHDLEYVVIKVFPFEEIPVICKKDGNDVKKGVIYCRSKKRRPESAPVSDSYEMREIIKIATLRMMRKKQELGYKVENSIEEKLNKELGELL